MPAPVDRKPVSVMVCRARRTPGIGKPPDTTWIVTTEVRAAIWRRAEAVFMVLSRGGFACPETAPAAPPAL